MRAAALALLAAGVLTVSSAAATKPSPEELQARYDRARDRLLAHPGDRAALAELARVEHLDGRPPGTLVLPPLSSLPKRAMLARAAGPEDQALSLRLERLGRSFPGWASFWVHDLATGRTAQWNSDARFPAASTVKLGVLAAALRHFGPHPERTPAWYDLRQVAAWSSNLAANRLVDQVGGTGEVEQALRRLGMWSSTYPGPYRAGSSAGDAPKPPPQAHWRVTTAHDLGRALWRLQAGAVGNRYAQGLTRLTRHQSEAAVRLLLSADPRGANAGLLRPSFPDAPLAQKNGWISDTRATAAIIYLDSGPKIAVVMAYAPHLRVASARGLGRSFAGLLR